MMNMSYGTGGNAPGVFQVQKYDLMGNPITASNNQTSANMSLGYMFDALKKKRGTYLADPSKLNADMGAFNSQMDAYNKQFANIDTGYNIGALNLTSTNFNPFKRLLKKQTGV